MPLKRLCLLPVLFVAFLVLQGCTAAYSTATDERLAGTVNSDNAIITLILKNYGDDPSGVGRGIAVYCYYGHVFLVGTCPQNLRAKAVEIARRDKRVHSVTTHWFTPRPAEENNLAMEAKLRATLIGTKNLISTRIDSVVNSNRVVLMGVAKDKEERKTAVEAARKVKGVVSVTSYIMLPMKPDTNYMPTGATYKGYNPPAAEAGKAGQAGQGAQKTAKKDQAKPKEKASAQKKTQGKEQTKGQAQAKAQAKEQPKAKTQPKEQARPAPAAPKQQDNEAPYSETPYGGIDKI